MFELYLQIVIIFIISLLLIGFSFSRLQSFCLFPVRGLAYDEYPFKGKFNSSSYLATVNNTKNFHTLVPSNQKSELSKNWVTGFCDGESSFMVFIAKNPAFKLGWRVSISFSIHLHNKDLDLLRHIQSYFKGVPLASSLAKGTTLRS